MVSISLPVCLGNPYVCPMVPQPPPLCSWSLSLCRFPFQLITLIYFPLCPSQLDCESFERPLLPYLVYGYIHTVHLAQYL